MKYLVLSTIAVCSLLTVDDAQVCVAQTSADWQQYYAVYKEYTRHSGAGRWNDAAEQAERLRTLVEQRFPRRTQVFGLEPLAASRFGQARYAESLKLYEQVIDQFRKLSPQSTLERNLMTNMFGESLRSTGNALGRLGRDAERPPYYQEAIAWWRQVDSPLSRGSIAQNYAELAFTYRRLGQDENAIAHFRKAAQMLEKEILQEKGWSTVLADTLAGWGALDNSMGRYDLAEPILRRAVGLAVSIRGWNHPYTASILVDMGNVYDSQGRWAEAEPYYRAALEAYESTLGKNHPDTTKALTNLGRILRGQGRQAEAEEMFRRIVVTLETAVGRDHYHTANALLNLGVTLQQQGKHDDAVRIVQRSLDIRESAFGPYHEDVAESLFVLAAVKLDQQEPDQALELLDRVISIHQHNPLSAAEMSRVHFVRARALWQTGRRDEAIAGIETSVEQAEFQRRFSSGTERERAALFGEFSQQFDQSIEWHAELNNVAELFHTIEQKKARSFLDELRLKNVDLLNGLPASERTRLNDRADELRRQLSEAERRFNALSAASGKPSDEMVEERKELASDVLAARDALYQHFTDIRNASPVYRKLIASEAITASLSDVQSRLAVGEVMLAYHLGAQTSYVVAIRSNGSAYQRLDVDEDVAQALGIHAGPLTNGRLSQVLLNESRGVIPSLSSPHSGRGVSDKLAALWKVLIPEQERIDLTHGAVTVLTILPDGPLALLPFETLVVSEAGEADPEYLLDVGPPIAYAPSASVLLNLAQREKASSTAPPQLFTLGDPAYPQSSATAQDAIDRHLGIARADDHFRASLSRLPYTGWESTWVQQTFEKAGFRTEKLSGVQATEAAIRRDAPGCQILHLACHGMASQSYGNFFGSLAVAPGRTDDPNDDGFLSMGEIYELGLTGCELAILSACETNYGPQQKGEGVWALSRGFLVAGARRVVASNWVVDDKAGATLISYFASYLSRAGKDASARDYASALHKAKQLVRKDQDSNGWSHPFYWSSLVLVGPK